MIAKFLFCDDNMPPPSASGATVALRQRHLCLIFSTDEAFVFM